MLFSFFQFFFVTLVFLPWFPFRGSTTTTTRLDYEIESAAAAAAAAAAATKATSSLTAAKHPADSSHIWASITNLEYLHMTHDTFTPFAQATEK
jgi:hypothetical protein